MSEHPWNEEEAPLQDPGYDSELDDPEDDTTGYENEADAEGDFATETEAYEEAEDE